MRHNRETRPLAIAYGLGATTEIGLKEHDRLALARRMMERKLIGRRTSSNVSGELRPFRLRSSTA
ncbi:hypothetical protein ATY30_28435 [Sinorhizobium americanum]|nr:hypothetical protein ATY30_28435 [Sinorhizobium americanum]